MRKNIISIENLSKAYAGKVLANSQTFGVHEGDKIGLVGVNGCGKSTFLKMLAGTEYLDEGRITLRNDIKVGYLPQQAIIDKTHTVFDHLFYSNNKAFKLLREFHKVSTAMRTNPDLKQKQQELMLQLDACNAWSIESKAKNLLTRFGLSDFEQPSWQLSGGQRRRLDLARVLLNDPDLLILDEPTNHLDVDTIEWFQNYILSYNGTVLFVTHDRYFLDAASNRIMEIENGVYRFYEGNYAYYLEQKELQDTDARRKETRRQAQLQKEIAWLQRGARARATKPKNHVDRVKELLSKSYLVSQQDLDISFTTQRLGKTILEIGQLSKGYGETKLIDNFSHVFQKMERIGVIGPNGCGKTTLLNLIGGEQDPDSGSVKTGVNTNFAWFKQESEKMDENLSVLEYIRQWADNIRTADGTLHSASQMLERFLFPPKLQQAKIASLSGGERKRLYLLKALMFGANFIVLDEPTNDLDIRTLEILEDYLDAFKGCLLVVSHDRYFLDRTTDSMFIFEEDGIRKFPGNYSDYLLVKRFSEEEKKEAVAKPQTQRPRAVRKLSWKEEQELKALEQKLEQLSSQRQKLETELAEQSANLDHTGFAKYDNLLKQNAAEQEQAETRWLELQEKLEG